MSRVLVTGATGFIGRHTLEPLLDAGLEVHAVTSREQLASAPAEVRWHTADLLAPDAAAQVMRKARPTHLLHLAWYAEPGAFWMASQNLEWVEASLRLLRAFATNGGRRAVFAGTCAEYTWQQHTHCVELATPARAATSGRPAAPARAATATRPATLYGTAKHGLRVVAETWAQQAEIEFAWGRIFLLYGPHEHPARLAAQVASALVEGRQVNCSHGQQVRDFLYVPELARAFKALLVSDITGPINMASGEPVRVADVVAALADAAGRPDLVRLGARLPAPDEPDELTAEVRRLSEEVGWKPSMDLREGAARTVSWWRAAA